MSSLPKPQCRRVARRAVLAWVAPPLCLVLAVPPSLAAEGPVARGGRTSSRHVGAPLTKRQKTLHALDRFTFGPRPGEVAEVEQTGLDAWFERQLHPETIPDDSFAARLAQYPAMLLSQEQLVARYPTPAMLRRYAQGGLAAPVDPVEHAIYADAALRFQEKRDKLETTQAASPGQSAVPKPLADSHAAADAETLPDPGLRDALLASSPAARLQQLVSLSPERMERLQKAMKGPEQARLLEGLTPVQEEVVAAMRSPEEVVSAEVVRTRLLRDVYSQRQLQAVMVDFWLNHFNVFLHKNQNEPYLIPAYEREAILPHALGSFEDLLVATAKSPAMLEYLDNADSTGPDSPTGLRSRGAGQKRALTPQKRANARAQGINENYARELMELHTLGVKGGYTQQDVVEVARCFTGWTVDRTAAGGQFRFDPNRHEPGQKVVLGHVIPSSGMDEGLQVLHLLASSPATAHFISDELAQRFVSDTPPADLVDRMTTVFLRSHGDLKAVLTALYRSAAFWSSSNYHVKVKTPLEFAVSALRATDASITRPASLVQALDRLGMPLYGMQTPNGYSPKADAWVSSNALLARMNFALTFAGNRLRGTQVSWPQLLGKPFAQSQPGTARSSDEETEAKLEELLLDQPATSQTRIAALQTLQECGDATKGTVDCPDNARIPVSRLGNEGYRQPMPSDQNALEHKTATVAGLLLGSPEFQRR